MSSVIDIVFDRDVAGYAPDDRYSLACVYFEAEFEGIAKRLGVAPLTAFYSDDPNSLDNNFDQDFFADPAELEALRQKMGPEKFFEPADALKSVTALRDHLRESPLKLAKPPQRGAERVARELIDELTEVERSLNLAKSQGVKFHFVLTPD
jgi:hypothetical protein